LTSGYYAACAGLKAQTESLDLLSNNLANINTSGYRAQQASFRTLLASARTPQLGELNRAVNDFGVLGGSRVNLSAGSLEQTANPLDLAIEGGAFFAVETKAGVHYTRNGRFQVSANGQLTTAEGDPVLGEKGAIVVPSGAVAISSDGTVSVGGAVVAKLRLVEFSPGAPLTSAGGAQYDAPADSVTPASRSYVRQGFVESSNVNPIAATVGLIGLQRHAEMLQRALSVFYSEFNRIAASDLPRI
jgi:flagellar basal-body rod protein FlgF